MTPQDLVIIGGAFTVVFIPALALTARLIMRPLVDSIIRLRDTTPLQPPNPTNDPNEVRLLRQEVYELRQKMEHLEQVVEFERELSPGAKRQLPGS
ncbi:MAG TPA: hypothetical protein VM100_13180 [Longimicrobiales bacterium]|nr:hypothetical protein [Longimicrobiales bacterium]